MCTFVTFCILSIDGFMSCIKDDFFPFFFFFFFFNFHILLGWEWRRGEIWELEHILRGILCLDLSMN
jgi:hypothetical protein